MTALNMAFDIPQSPAFDVEKFRQQVMDYANKLIHNVVKSQTDVHHGHRVLDYNELSPEIQSLIGVCKGAVREDDINGESAREEYLKDKYGDA